MRWPCCRGSSAGRSESWRANGRVRGRRGEGTEGVAHGAHGEGREARGGQRGGPRGAEHVGRLLPLLPLGPPILEPHLVCGVGGGGQGNIMH